MDFETTEFPQDMWNHDLMRRFLLSQITSNAISNHKLWQSSKAFRSDLVLLPAMTLSNICWMEYANTMDALKMQCRHEKELVQLLLDEHRQKISPKCQSLL